MAISGTVTDSGSSAVEGATVVAIDTVSDTVIGTDVTAADGSYSITTPSATTAHVFVQYDDGVDKWHSLSNPYLSVTADVLMIDSFETDLSAYTVNGDYSITSNFATDGTQGLETGTTTGTMISQPGDGLDNYPVRGDTFKYDFISTTGSGGSDSHRWFCCFGVDSTVANYYRVDADFDNAAFNLWEIGPNNRFGNQGGITIPANEHLSVTVDWDSASTDTISAVLHNEDTDTEISSISGTSTFRDDGGFGWDYSFAAGERFNCDFARITN